MKFRKNLCPLKNFILDMREVSLEVFLFNCYKRTVDNWKGLQTLLGDCFFDDKTNVVLVVLLEWISPLESFLELSLLS